MVRPEQALESNIQIENRQDDLFARLDDRYSSLRSVDNAERGGAVAKVLGIGAVLSAAAVLFVPPAVGGAVARLHAHGSADMEKAHTTSEAKALVFNEDQQIDVGTAYFEEKFSATKIPYSIDWQPLPVLPDVIPDFTVNKELRGVGREKFLVPFKALDAKLDPATGKTNITVDKTDVVVSSAWKEPPVTRDFVIKGNHRVYNADSGKANLVKNISDHFTHFSQDQFTNTIKDLDLQTTRAMANKALSTFTQQCPTQMDSKLKVAINKAITANIQSTGQDKAKIGDINYTVGAFKWTEEPTPPIVQSAVDKTYKHNANVTVKQNFKVDEMTCDVSGIQKEQ